MGSCYGFDLAVAQFVFDRGEHAERGVAALAVVEDLEVFEDRVGQFQAGPPLAAVEQFGLHAAPERLDHRVVVAVADRAHGGHQAGVAGAVGEGPGGVLHPVVGVDQRPGAAARLRMAMPRRW